MADIEIGIFKSGRRAYGFDDIAIVPSRRTRDPEDVDISWEIDAYKFELPVMGAAMDGVMSPATAIELGHLGDRGLDRERDEIVGPRVDERPLVRTADRRARRADDHSFRHQRKALSPVSARPMISFWIWLVPSYSVVTLASRRYFPTGYSST